jgi:hypothetical protein
LVRVRIGGLLSRLRAILRLRTRHPDYGEEEVGSLAILATVRDRRTGMAKPKRGGHKVAADPTGEELRQVFLTNRDLVEGTEQGLKDIEEGRFATLAEVKRRLGDV